MQELYRVEGSLAFLSLVGSFLIILSAMFVKVPRYTPAAAHAPLAHQTRCVPCVCVARVSAFRNCDNTQRISCSSSRYATSCLH